jgi:hypothetical protein
VIHIPVLLFDCHNDGRESLKSEGKGINMMISNEEWLSVDGREKVLWKVLKAESGVFKKVEPLRIVANFGNDEIYLKYYTFSFCQSS